MVWRLKFCSGDMLYKNIHVNIWNKYWQYEVVILLLLQYNCNIYWNVRSHAYVLVRLGNTGWKQKVCRLKTSCHNYFVILSKQHACDELGNCCQNVVATFVMLSTYARFPPSPMSKVNSKTIKICCDIIINGFKLVH